MAARSVSDDAAQRRSALPVLAWLVASGCGAVAPVGGPPAAAPPESGKQVLGRICAPCHPSGQTDRPDLSVPEPPQAVAGRALRAVVAGEMPPRSATDISPEGRDALISFLCQRAGHREAACEAIARRDTRSPIRAAPTFFQSVGRVTAREIPEHLRELSFLHTDPEQPRVVLTPSGAALVTLVAASVCAQDPASAGGDTAELARCIHRVVQLGITPARPPAGHGARPANLRPGPTNPGTSSP